MTHLHGTPEFAAAASERLKRLNADPEFKAKQLAGRQRMRRL